MIKAPKGFRLLDEIPAPEPIIFMEEKAAQYWLDCAKKEGASITPDLETKSLTRSPSMPSKAPRGNGLPVTLVTCSMLAGGAERVTVHLAVELAKLGFDITVLNVGAVAGTHGDFIKCLNDNNIAYKERICDGSEENVIMSGKATVWWGHALLQRIERKKYIPGSIYVAHSSGKWTAEAIDQCKNGISYGVGVSGPASQLINHQTGLKATTIWNGIEEFECPPKKRGKEFILGYLGRYSPEKNPVAAIEALKYLPEEVRLRCYGWGALDEAMFRAAKEYRVSNRFDLGGTITDLKQAFSEFDALIIPSVFEGFPMTVIESMFGNTPVITGPHGDLPYVCKDGERGLIIKPNAHSIAGGVMRLLDYPERAQQIAINSSRFAKEHLTAEKMAWAYGRMIKKVIKEEKNAS